MNDLDLDIDVGVDEDALDADIVARLQKGEIQVPPFPRVVLELQALMAKGAGLGSFVDVVAKDPALAARVLRVANSASFGRAESVSTLAAAVTALGTQMLQRIALADGLASKACADGPLVALRDQAWRQSVTSALLSSTLATARGLPADEVFVCGLLHNFGRLLAVRVIEDVIADGGIVALDAVGSDVWRELVNKYRTELGILAAERWQLPETLREVITTHHLRPKNKPIIQLINAVDNVIDLLEDGSALDLDELAAVDGIGAKDAALLYRSLPALPALQASFTIERLSARPATVSTLPPAPPPSTTVTATTQGTAAPRTFEVRQLTMRGVVLIGKDGLAPNQVFRLRFAFGATSLDVWLRITALKTVNAGAEVHAVPFALRGEEAGAWYSRVRAFNVNAQASQAA